MKQLQAVRGCSKLTSIQSVFFYLQVVQEYERAVIFRLGRLLSGGSRGPGEILFLCPGISDSVYSWH